MRIFYIFSFILLITKSAESQVRSMPLGEPETRILKFYPNPASSMITFEFQTDVYKSFSFQIFNFLGRKVYESQTSSAKTVVNLSDFVRGIYIYQLRDPYGKVVETGKFQVMK